MFYDALATVFIIGPTLFMIMTLHLYTVFEMEINIKNYATKEITVQLCLLRDALFVCTKIP